jgi:predicted dehydrogenase
MLNFAVIGTGAFGVKRAKAIQECKNAKLVAICDKNSENAERAQKILGAESKSLDQILQDKKIDVVSISTPNKFHLPIIVESLNAGKHVFCEKPLCRNLEEAKKIYEHSEKADTIFQMGSNHRYFESVMYAKKLLEKNEIGDVLSFNGRIGHDGERLKNSWFWNKELSGGGTLLDNGCHLLELSRYFVGDFISGGGSVSNSYWKNIEVEDTASGFFKTADGKTATIFCSWRLLSGYFFFEINGSEGYINVDGRFDTHGGDKIFWLNKKKNKILSKDFSKIKPQSYKLEVENFIDTIQNKRNTSPSAKDALEVMRMIDFVYSSNKK